MTDPIAIRRAALEEAAQWHEKQAAAWLDQAASAQKSGEREQHETYAAYRILHLHSARDLRHIAGQPPPVQSEGWRSDMEAAPRNGESVDLWCVHDTLIAQRSPDMYWDEKWRDQMGLPLNPGWTATHWRSCPAPPAEDKTNV